MNHAWQRFQRMIFPLTCGITPISMYSLIQGMTTLDLSFADWEKDLGAGNFWEMTAIAALVRRLNPKICLEIGTGHGRTSLNIALNSSPEAKIYTCDISSDPRVGSIYKSHPKKNMIHQITTDTKKWDYSFLKGRCNFVLIDGGHDYTSVTNDSKIAFEVLAPGGVIIWDDFDPGWPGVVKGVKSLLKSLKQNHHQHHQHQHQIYRLVGTSYAYYQD